MMSIYLTKASINLLTNYSFLNLGLAIDKILPSKEYFYWGGQDAYTAPN